MNLNNEMMMKGIKAEHEQQLTDLSWGVPPSYCQQFAPHGAQVEERPLLIERSDLEPFVKARVVAVGAVYGRLSLGVISTLAWRDDSSRVVSKKGDEL